MSQPLDAPHTVAARNTEEPERLQIVDVTLRDGGFHNDWAFERRQVEALLAALDAAGVDWAELGYRSPATPSASSPGPADEGRIDALPHLQHTRLAVMVEAAHFTSDETLIDRLFPSAGQSRVGLVRVAARREDLPVARRITRRLDRLGYLVALNLIDARAAGASGPDELHLLGADGVKVLVLADTIGDLYPTELRALHRALTAPAPLRGQPALGVHLHDALGLAFANALTAIELGIRWVDASVLGMGRGSGNLRTELLVQHLEFHVGDRQRRSAPLHALIASTWQPLSDRYRWGPHPAYAYAAQLGLHPSYPQALVTEHGLALSSIFSILEILARRVDRRRFDHGALLEARATHASEHEVLA